MESIFGIPTFHTHLEISDDEELLNFRDLNRYNVSSKYFSADEKNNAVVTQAFGGAANVTMIVMGFVGSATTGIMADRTKRFGEITKVFLGGATLSAIFMFEFYLLPKKQIALLIFCGLFGFFGIGVFPVGLELAVEITYPVDETISTAFIFLCGQMQSTFFIFLVPAVAGTQDPELAYLNKCGSLVDNEPKDYKLPLMILMCYNVVLVCATILFLKSKYKRLEADTIKRNVDVEKTIKTVQIFGILSDSTKDLNPLKKMETKENTRTFRSLSESMSGVNPLHKRISKETAGIFGSLRESTKLANLTYRAN